MKKLFNSILPGLAVAFFACFMLFIYAPYELYLTNISEFWFTSDQMLPVAFTMFAAAFVACAMMLFVSRCIGEKYYHIMFALVFIAALSCYVHGSLLVYGLPGLDGTEVDWSAYPEERIKSLLVWVFIAAAVFVLMKKIGPVKLQKGGAIVCFALSLMLVLSLDMLLLNVDADKEQRQAVTDKDMFLMSEEQNFVIFVLDSIDAVAFEKILDIEPSYRDVFDGFTFYDNTMAAYPLSQMSMAYILTGQWYEAQSEFAKYVSSAVRKSEFFYYLNTNEYLQNVYLDEIEVSNGLNKSQFSNIIKDKPVIDSKVFMAKLLMKMTIIKHAPWDLKFLGYDLLGRLKEHRVLDSDIGSEYFDGLNTTFYSQIKNDNPVTIIDDKCFKYIHLEGAHRPCSYNKEVEISSDGNYWSSIEASITMTDMYFERLKEAGVYDNSVILVMADHGATDGDDPENMHQNPILMVKGINERHELKYNAAPISFADLQPAYIKLAEGESSGDVFDWQEGDKRERRFISYHWSDYSTYTEYVQTGHASDVSTLLPTGNIYKIK